MNRLLPRILLLTAVLCCLLSAAVAVGQLPPEQTDVAKPPATVWKLLFSGDQDIADPWGKLHFGVTPVRLIRECEPPGFTFIGGFPLTNGAWEGVGQQMTEVSRGDEPYDRITAWKLVRATTRDGVKFDGLETVFEPKPASWTDHAAMACNLDTKEYLLLKLKVDRSGFAYTAFFSPDGKQWQEHPGNPLFYEGDAMSLFWSPVLHRFVCVSKSLQPHRKRLLDHGDTTPSLGDDSLRDRRVLMMRSSPNGRRWEPSVSLSDVWNRNGRRRRQAGEAAGGRLRGHPAQFTGGSQVRVRFGEVIEKILRHCGLWDPSPPRGPPAPEGSVHDEEPRELTYVDERRSGPRSDFALSRLSTERVRASGVRPRLNPLCSRRTTPSAIFQ